MKRGLLHLSLTSNTVALTLMGGQTWSGIARKTGKDSGKEKKKDRTDKRKRERTEKRQQEWKEGAGRGSVPPTIERMREPSTSRGEPPDMGGIGTCDTAPCNQGNPQL